jgi:GDP-L-fucose synthase
MEKNSRIYVAGHRGLVGSALLKKLKEDGYTNIITRTRQELDLTNQQDTQIFFANEQPEYVFDCAALVGGIHDNNIRRADFMYSNLQIQNNIIHWSHIFGVKKLLFLGSSCFVSGTIIQTNNGPKNIEDIKIGDLVLTHKNNYKKVYHTTKRIEQQSIMKIQSIGWNNIECTKTHEILTKNKGYVRADKLEKNDILMIPKDNKNKKNDIVNIIVEKKDNNKFLAYQEMLNSDDFSPTKLSKKYNLTLNTISGWYYNNTKPRICNLKNDTHDLKNGLSRLCGYYLAEGWISGNKTNKRGSKHNIMLSPGYNEEFANDIYEKFIDVFNIIPEKKLMKTSYKIGYHSNKNIYSFFEQFYDLEKCHNHKSHNKIIPQFIIDSSDKSIKELIKGYWIGDGHYTKRKERKSEYLATASSVSKKLIYQLQKLLLRFDIMSSIYFHKKPKTCVIEERLVNQRSSYELKITGIHAINFIEKIMDEKIKDKTISERKNKPKFDENYMYLPIRKIEEMSYKGFVYDLSVEDDISYTANGFAVHNCIYPKMCPQPIKEEYLLTSELEQTNEPYAISKIAGIKMCESYRRQYGCNFISVMPTNLYGSENDNYDLEKSHVFAAMIRKFHDAKVNGSEKVELWGDGTPFREFLHVDDFAECLVFLMNNYNEEQPLNIGTGKDISIFDLAHKIKDVIGFDGEIEWDTNKPNGTPKKLLDVSKLHSLGWKHTIELDEGIRITYDRFLNKKPTKL